MATKKKKTKTIKNFILKHILTKAKTIKTMNYILSPDPALRMCQSTHTFCALWL